MKNKLTYIIILVITITLLIGCTKTDEKEKIETNKDKYIKYIQKLKNISSSSPDLPFDVNVSFYTENENEVRFEVVIDNPKDKISNIRAVAIHDKQTDDVFPSVGIFDKPITLVKDEKPEGVVLVGYIPHSGELDELKCEIKVIITYEYDNNKHTSYYLTKK